MAEETLQRSLYEGHSESMSGNLALIEGLHAGELLELTPSEILGEPRYFFYEWHQVGGSPNVDRQEMSNLRSRLGKCVVTEGGREALVSDYMQIDFGIVVEDRYGLWGKTGELNVLSYLAMRSFEVYDWLAADTNGGDSQAIATLFHFSDPHSFPSQLNRFNHPLVRRHDGWEEPPRHPQRPGGWLGRLAERYDLNEDEAENIMANNEAELISVLGLLGAVKVNKLLDTQQIYVDSRDSNVVSPGYLVDSNYFEVVDLGEEILQLNMLPANLISLKRKAASLIA